MTEKKLYENPSGEVMVNVEYADLLERKLRELENRLGKLYRGLEPMAHAPTGQPVLVDGDLLRELTALAKLPTGEELPK